MLHYSIIVCTYNRSDFLKETIDSILAVIRGAQKFELLIIDNNSKDNTAEVVKPYLSIPYVRYVLETNQGLSFARNRGIKESRNPIIVFLDDDIDLPPNYFELLDSLYSDPSVNIVGGKVLSYKVPVPEWLPEKFHYLVSLYDMGDKPKHVNKLLGANHSFRREVANRVGDYNVKMGPQGDFKLGGDENEFLLRARRLGYRLLYYPDLLVYHKIENRFTKEFILQYAYNIGATEAKIDATHRKGLMTLKILKYISDRLKTSLLSKNGHLNLPQAINQTQKNGYLEFIKNYMLR